MTPISQNLCVVAQLEIDICFNILNVRRFLVTTLRFSTEDCSAVTPINDANYCVRSLLESGIIADLQLVFSHAY